MQQASLDGFILGDKMSKEKGKQLANNIEERIRQEIATFDRQIIQLNNQMNQLAGAKSYAENLLKELEKKDGRSL